MTSIKEESIQNCKQWLLTYRLFSSKTHLSLDLEGVRKFSLTSIEQEKFMGLNIELEPVTIGLNS